MIFMTDWSGNGALLTGTLSREQYIAVVWKGWDVRVVNSSSESMLSEGIAMQ